MEATKSAFLDWAPLAIAVTALLVSIAAAAGPYWRRPNLSLLEDPDRSHSRVEGNGIPHLRLVVANAKGKRSAKQARVVLDGYRPIGSLEPWTRLGSPFLAWPSTLQQDSDSSVPVVFSDAERPVGLGQFLRVRVGSDGMLEREEQWRQNMEVLPPAAIRHFADAATPPEARWRLHLDLADNYALTDERDWLAPGSWTIRLIVGADDGDSHAYEVDVGWKGDEPDADAVLRAALDHLAVRSAQSR